MLLFDEPLSNLDTQLRRSMRKKIRDLQKRLQLTVVYITHDQSEALAISYHVVLMHQGRVAQTGTPEILYREPRDAFVATFLGDCNLAEGRLIEVDGALGPSALAISTCACRTVVKVPVRCNWGFVRTVCASLNRRLEADFRPR